jgi:mono/diheme cytochrome c family protein
MLTTILLSVLAQAPCNVRGSYPHQATVRTYTVPLYQQSYATYAQPAQVQTAYVATEYYDYASIVGAATRAQDRRQEALLGQANLAAKVAELSASVSGLTALLQRDSEGGGAQPPPEPPPQPAPPPVAPGKPAPGPGGPPLPGPNPAPDDGSVPPPPAPAPAVPPSAGGAAPPATFALLRDRCMKCHSAVAAGTSGGGFAMFAADGSLANLGVGRKLDVMNRVQSGNMPRKAKPLESDELALVRLWVYQDPKAIDAFLAAAAARGVE